MSFRIKVSYECAGETNIKHIDFESSYTSNQIIQLIQKELGKDSSTIQHSIQLFYKDSDGVEHIFENNKTIADYNFTQSHEFIIKQNDKTNPGQSNSQICRSSALEKTSRPPLHCFHSAMIPQCQNTVSYNPNPNQNIPKSAIDYLKSHIPETYFLSRDDFEEIGEIGNNPLCKVSKIKHIETSELFVSKELSLNECISAKEFVREVELLVILKNYCVQKLYGIILPNEDDDDDNFVMITPYMKFGDLSKTINKAVKVASFRAKLNDTQKHIIFYGIAQAMKYLHKNNVVHRDIKPQNVLISEDLEPLITDFGLSKEESGFIQSRVETGTPNYMAPEVFNAELENGNAIYDAKKSDVYAFGMLGYFLYQRKEPFYSCKKIQEIRQKVVNGERPPFTGGTCPDHVKQLIEECWIDGPDQRPTFDEIVESLEDEKFLNLYTDFDREKFEAFRQKVHWDESAPTISIQHEESESDSALDVRPNTGLTPSHFDMHAFTTPNIISRENRRITESDLSDEDEDDIFTEDSEDQQVDFEQIKEQADQGDKDAQYSLGCMFNYGHHGQKDHVQAFHYFSLAAEQRHLNAVVEHAKCLKHGQGTDKNEKEALNQLLYTAEKENNAEAQYFLSKICKHQRPPNYSEMMKWLRMASDNKHGDACFDLAMCLEKKKNLPKSGPTEIFNLYETAFKYGSARGILYMANTYYKGSKFRARDLKMAHSLFLSSCKKKNQEAVLSVLAVFHHRSTMKKIFSFIQRIADANLFSGIIGLYECYTNGIGTEKDLKKAERYLHLAKDPKFASRQCSIGLSYLNRRSVLYNPKKAFFWMEISSNNGYIKGMVNVSRFYINGTGCQSNLDEAMKWAQLAAQKNNLHGKRVVAKIYHLRRVQALKECAEAGDSISMVTLAEIYKNDGQYKESFNYYKQASEHKNPEGLFQCGKFLYKGKHCLKDVNAGMGFIKQAADMSHRKALEFMIHHLTEQPQRSDEDNHLLSQYKRIFNELSSFGRSKRMFRES